METLEEVYHISRMLNEELKKEQGYKKILSELLGRNKLGTITHSHKECFIQEDWILEIEEKLPFVERALEERRHTLLKEGSVVRIDQVRKVSADSVIHLAQHSNFITDMPENTVDFMPKKLYVTENTETYRLYENKFLYTLLVYLKDFVENRYFSIISILREQKSEMKCDFSYETEHHKTKLSLELCEEDHQEIKKQEHQERGSLIERVHFVYEQILSLLNIPFMKMMHETDLLNMPIVTTNIIKSDFNFQEAYKLLDYILTYSEPGFEIHEINDHTKDFSLEGREDLASVLAFLELILEAEDTTKREQFKMAELNRRKNELPDEDKKLFNDLLEQSKKEWQERFELEMKAYKRAYEEEIEALKLAKDAEIAAIRARFYDFSEEDHLEESSFKRLMEEKKAFDRYFEEKWSKVKKNARKTYIWDQLKAK